MVRVHNGKSLRGVEAICGGKREGVAIGGDSEGGVGRHGCEIGLELAGEDLSPDSTGDGVSESTTDVVGCEEEPGDDSNI